MTIQIVPHWNPKFADKGIRLIEKVNPIGSNELLGSIVPNGDTYFLHMGWTEIVVKTEQEALALAIDNYKP